MIPLYQPAAPKAKRPPRPAAHRKAGARGLVRKLVTKRLQIGQKLRIFLPQFAAMIRPTQEKEIPHGGHLPQMPPTRESGVIDMGPFQAAAPHPAAGTEYRRRGPTEPAHARPCGKSAFGRGRAGQTTNNGQALSRQPFADAPPFPYRLPCSYRFFHGAATAGRPPAWGAAGGAFLPFARRSAIL